MYYKLVNKIPVKCTIEELSTFTADDKRVAYDKFGEVAVSTVFLTIDHGLLQNGEVLGIDEILLFETMIFGGEHDGYQVRFATWNEAVIGHKEACDLVNKLAIERNNKLDDLGV